MAKTKHINNNDNLAARVYLISTMHTASIFDYKYLVS